MESIGLPTYIDDAKLWLSLSYSLFVNLTGWLNTSSRASNTLSLGKLQAESYLLSLSLCEKEVYLFSI